MFARKSGLAGVIDRILLINPTVAAFISFGGFIPIVASVIIGVGSFEYVLNVNGADVNKQVGFIWALNWSVSLLILIPMIVYFGLVSYRGFRGSLDSLASKKMILNNDGSSVTSGDLFDAWRTILITVSIAVVLIIVLTIAYAYWEYWTVVGQHFERGSYPKISLDDRTQEMDWSVAALLPVAGGGPNPVVESGNRIFSFIMYLLLPGLGTGVAFGFFVFLIGFIWFLFKISDQFLFLPDLDDTDPRRGFQVFSEVVENAIWVTMMMFFVCYLMIIQNLYLRDYSPSIYDFMTPDIFKGVESLAKATIWKKMDASVGLITAHPGVFNLQGEISLAITFLTTATILGFVVLTLRHIARRCQDRVIDELNSEQPTLSFAENADKDLQIERARQMNYWPAAWPTVNTLLWFVLGSVVCIFFYKIGLYMVGVIILYLLKKILGHFRIR